MKNARLVFRSRKLFAFWIARIVDFDRARDSYFSKLNSSWYAAIYLWYSKYVIYTCECVVSFLVGSDNWAWVTLVPHWTPWWRARSYPTIFRETLLRISIKKVRLVLLKYILYGACSVLHNLSPLYNLWMVVFVSVSHPCTRHRAWSIPALLFTPWRRVRSCPTPPTSASHKKARFIMSLHCQSTLVHNQPLFEIVLCFVC